METENVRAGEKLAFTFFNVEVKNGIQSTVSAESTAPIA